MLFQFHLKLIFLNNAVIYMTSLSYELRPEFQEFVLRQIDELIKLQNTEHEK
jgi:hypothetical protein